jgi:ubiquinone/menaquinone biosynthesis C-methylase UbiE
LSSVVDDKADEGPVRPHKVDRERIDYTSHLAAYDERFRHRVTGYKERLRRRSVLKAVGSMPRNARILDVGCGTGRGLWYLLSAGFYRLTGVDYTMGMLEKIPGNVYSQFPGSEVSRVRGDAFYLPFSDNAFDLVTSLNFLHMFRLALQHRIVREMRRVCRPGGLIVVELESIHKGLSRYREQRRVAHRTKFTSLAEVRSLFSTDTFSHVRVVGTTLPVCYRVLSHVPRLGAVIESVALVPPCNWLSERVIVAGRLGPNVP